MNTLKNKRITILQSDSISYLKQNLKILNFSPKAIKAYLYYNKELLCFANYKPLKEFKIFNIILRKSAQSRLFIIFLDKNLK